MARWTELFLSECNKHGLTVSVINTNISSKRASHKDRSFGVYDELLRSQRIVSEFRRRIKQESIDVIHICSPCSRFGLLRDWICVLTAKGKPVVFHCHCNIEDQAKTRISKLLLGKIVNRSEKVIVLNESSRKFIERIEMNKAVIIPNFIEDNKVKMAHSISQRVEKVVYVGHVKKKKGIKEIFCVARRTPQIRFDIIGPVQELPENQEKPDNVNLIGEVPHNQVSTFLEQADVFLFPSYTEGFANVMLEAMAEGLPIIASDVGANKDMIEDKGGIIVPVKDEDAICNALKAMDDPCLRQQMSSWNISKVREQYTLSNVIPAIKACYIGEQINERFSINS
ncbi:MAG: glycosyltransferase family 4 protein [Clostridia bacterium]|nr:glycosyltransferase family 4 protein [Clostridia bacterium]